MTYSSTDMLPLARPGPLPDFIAIHLGAIRALCREFGVARLEVFGSVLTPHFDPATSDIDLLVEYLPGYDLGPWAGQHTRLTEQLAAVLGRPVDLVMVGAVRKPRFIEAIRDNRTLLYVA